MNVISRLWARLRRRRRFRCDRAQGLEQPELHAQEEFASQIESNVDDYLNQYRKRFGKTINTDNAKLLYKPYARSRRDQARYSRAVYSPAKSLANELYRREIESSLAEHVIFMGGGTASGKSSGLKVVEGQIHKADVVLDGTLSSFDGVYPQILSALDRNLAVDVIYVHCPFEVAMLRAVLRAADIGRTLSLDVMAGSHYYSQRTLTRLYDEFEGNPDFCATVIDNTSEPVVLPGGVGYIKNNLYSSLDELCRVASNRFDQACDEFHKERGHALPEHFRAAFLRKGRKVSCS